MTQPTHFNAIDVDLQGTNLVEASAGTGKTYSVAILVLRLLIDKGLPLKEILMVTFTNAAVAELEERIRHFVRQAHRYACEGDQTVDEGIRKVVDNAVNDSRTKCQIQEGLRRAVLLLDETSILTIHSFCQQTLRECAFETGQLFGAELIEDDSAIVEGAVNQFWRKEVTTLPSELLQMLNTAGALSREKLLKLVQQVTDGKEFCGYDLQDNGDTIPKQYESILTHIENNASRLRGLTAGRGAWLEPLVSEPAQFLNAIVEKKVSNKPPQYIVPFAEELDLFFALVGKLYYDAATFVKDQVAFHKQRNSQLQFDDLIEQLYTAICEKRDESLLAILRNKYKAVFVDEFQDTDWQQYKIFQKAFQDAPIQEGQTAPIVFYIGDPKQSIYGFRKADLDVYFGAGTEPGVIQHTMNVNHRSSPLLVMAMNKLFAISNPFMDARLQYQPVEASPHKKDCFYREGALDKPLTIIKLQHHTDIAEAVARQVWQLLHSSTYGYVTEGAKEPVRQADIGILVRKKQQAKAVKLALAKLGIPAVTVDDTKLLETDEARYLLYWLQACLDPQAGNINRALLSPFTGFTAGGLLQRNQDEDSRRFRRYQHLLDNKGIYKALTQFVDDYNVREVAASAVNGDRTLANLLQLAEQLHEVQTGKKYTPSELVCWLQRGMESGEHTGEQFQQRLESDEQAVKIVTIHKSKGLEYKIMLAPFLDLTVNVTHHRPFYSFKENSRYVVMEYKKVKEDPAMAALYQQQEERENCRLLYVAITRAVHKCILFKAHDENQEPVASAFLPFFNGCEERGEGLVEVVELLAIDARKIKPAGEKEKRAKPREVNFQLSQQGWCKLSFTYLAAKGHAAGTKNQDDCGEGYDDFIFKQLRKGEKTGLMLHSIFEHIDFSNRATWMPVIEDTLRRNLPTAGDDFKKHLHELVETVIETPVHCNSETVLLGNVDNHHRLNEFEFDFNVQRFDLKDLSVLLEKQGVKFKYESQKDLEGVMYGLMDLFFVHKNKFYILDWKSNHLGYIVADYNSDRVEAAMRENNYHLQYLLYTLAAKKFLESRLDKAFEYERDFGGVIYLFLRGVRRGKETGVFSSKPSLIILQAIEDLLSPSQAAIRAKDEVLETKKESVL